MSRGLLISIGVTLLAVGLLFVYFRNKVNSMEKKVELMFNLIQNYEGQQNMQNMPVVQQQSTMSQEVPRMTSELIEVSDDDEDSEEVSDSEDEESDDEQEPLRFEPTNIVLNDEEVKTINLENLEENNDTKKDTSKEETPTEENLEEKEDSLDDESDVDSDNESDEEEEEVVEEITLSEEDIKKKTVPELKKIAAEKGLQNYKSLKKAALINLLISQ